MEELGGYAISIVTAAMLCGILLGFVPKGSAGELIKLLCGLFMTLTVLSPFVKLDFGDFLEDFNFSLEGKWAAQEGAAMARESAADIIKAETEAYILDKAAEVNASVCVEVSLSEDPVPMPVGVTLWGEVSPYVRQRLENVLTRELGIAKEELRWSSQPCGELARNS